MAFVNLMVRQELKQSVSLNMSNYGNRLGTGYSWSVKASAISQPGTGIEAGSRHVRPGSVCRVDKVYHAEPSLKKQPCQACCISIKSRMELTGEWGGIDFEERAGHVLGMSFAEEFCRIHGKRGLLSQVDE